MQYNNEFEINPFKPKKGAMVDEMTVILVILFGWGMVNFGFQALLMLLADTPLGDGMLTRITFLSFPWHFWFTGQFLPLWFIILCVIFNLYIDRVTERQKQRRDRTYE
jgi:putative solute:sodium symporter small subunit